MRDSLRELLSKAIVFEYSLPHNEKRIDKTIHTTEEDNCMRIGTTNTDISKIIFNGIIEYSYDEWEIDFMKLNSLQRKALKTKIRFDEDADLSTKIKYGFYGEILLYLVLQYYHHAETLTARGKFYNLLEKSETKGYDTYQLKYNPCDSKVELWFGEVKFYQNYKVAIDRIFENINKALSDKYFEENLIAIFDKADDSHLPEQIKSIKEAWEEDPDINIMQEIKDRSIILVYPIIIVFDEHKNKEYDVIIREVINYINTKDFQATLTFPYKLFFILLPVPDGKTIKEQVITWISNNEPQI